MNEYSIYNAQNVLEKVNDLIGRKAPYISYDIWDVYDELSIFDWFKPTLTLTELKQMKSFLENAIKLGYKGYVCFKVGAKYCANGMWAHKEESTSGRSPNCDCLYRSFSPEYTYYSISINNKWYPDVDKYNKCKTIKSLMKEIKGAKQC